MTGSPRPNIEVLPAYTPGRSAEMVAAQHGIDEAIKLASNELPFGPLPSVAEAIRHGVDQVADYPDHGAATLRADLATHFGLDASQVTVGAGSAGILQQLVLAYVDPGQHIAMCWPSFEAYPLFAALVGAEQVRVPLVDSTFDLGRLAAAIDANTKLAFIANPNNPTGTVVGTAEVADFLAAVPRSCVVVLDEAYAEFVTDPAVTDSTRLIDQHPNLVITRTFSKAHGLAGLRVGYALGGTEVIGMIDRTLVPFAVNSLAQLAAQASLAATAEMGDRVADVVAERTRVYDALIGRDWQPPVPQGNFVWLGVGADAKALGHDLETRGVVTRAFPDVGVRVTIASPTWNDRFLAALTDARPTPTR